MKKFFKKIGNGFKKIGQGLKKFFKSKVGMILGAVLLATSLKYMSDYIWKGAGSNPEVVSEMVNKVGSGEASIVNNAADAAATATKLAENQSQIYNTPSDSFYDTFQVHMTGGDSETMQQYGIKTSTIPIDETKSLAEKVPTKNLLDPSSKTPSDIPSDTFNPKEYKMISAKEALEVDNLNQLYETIPEDQKDFFATEIDPKALPKDSEGFKLYTVQRSMGPTEFTKYLDGSSKFYDQYNNFISSSDATFSRVSKGMFLSPDELGAKPYKNIFSAIRQDGIGGAVKQIGGQSLTGLTRGAYTGVGGEMSAVGVAGTTASKVGTAMSLLSRNDYTPETYNPYAQSVAQANLAAGESYASQPTVSLNDIDTSSFLDSNDPMGIMKGIYDKAGVNHGYGYYAVNT